VGIRCNQFVPCRKVQRATLSKLTARKRADLQWTFFVSNHVEPPLIDLYHNRVLYPPEQRNTVVADKAEKELRESLVTLEQELACNPFFGRDQWGMADFMVASVLYLLTRINTDLTAYPKLDAWLVASINRPPAQSARKLRET